MIVNKDADFNKIIRQIDKRYNDGYYADKKQSGNETLAEVFVRLRNKEEIPAVAKVLVESYFGK